MSDLSGAPNALSATPTEPMSPTAPSVGTALNSLPGLVGDIIKTLEDNSSPQMIATYVAEFLALLGVVVGAFDHPLGLGISGIPQSVILGVSAVVGGAVTIARLIFKSRLHMAAVTAASLAAPHQAA